TMDSKAKVFIFGTGALLGGYAAWRSLGRKRINTLPYGRGVKVKKAVTINSSPEQLYTFWRRLVQVPRLFDNIISVEPVDETRSHWAVRVPGGIKLEWDAEVTVDRPGEMIGWRSLDGADIDNAGYVRFERATGGRGTVVRVALQYNPPAGKLGNALLTLLGENPAAQVGEALRRLKQLMEAGEIPVVDEKRLPHSIEPVEAASEDSFPASDAPAWTGTTGPRA